MQLNRGFAAHELGLGTGVGEANRPLQHQSLLNAVAREPGGCEQLGMLAFGHAALGPYWTRGQQIAAGGIPVGATRSEHDGFRLHPPGERRGAPQLKLVLVDQEHRPISPDLEITVGGDRPLIQFHALLAWIPAHPPRSHHHGLRAHPFQRGHAFQLDQGTVIEHRAAGCAEAIQGLSAGKNRAPQVPGLGHLA